MKKIVLLPLLLLALICRAQYRFSIATDVALMRNFSPKQKFFALGQTIQGNFHLNRTETAYAWIGYFTPGKFRNDFTGTAVSPATVPQTMVYRVTGRWRAAEISVGWKHFFRGGFEEETGWSLYSIAGFGLMVTKVENSFRPAVDTSVYNVRPLPGASSFKRLTLDLGLGVDIPLGGQLYVYGDIRTWIPASDYPSPYLHSNRNVPAPVTLSAGLRVLFGNSY